MNKVNEKQSDEMNSSQMKTISRMWCGMKSSARKSLSACSEAGERLAWFFGITKPKYYAEIERYENMEKDEKQAWHEAFQDIDHIDHVRDSINK